MSELNSLRWPAEWELHQATWMIFPCRNEIWRHGLEKAQLAFAEVANLISEFEPVKMLVRREHLAYATKKLSSAVELIEAELDDSWARDTAPIWVENNKQAVALDFQFNAWGNKFSPCNSDQKIAQVMAKNAASHICEIDLILEGGSIHGNGQGLLLTTKECLLNSNRNSQMRQFEIEEKLKSELGVNRIIWLEKGLNGDVDTDGHVDNIACFVSEDTILTQYSDSASENYAIYQQNKCVLQQEKLQTIEIMEPSARYQNGVRVPLSYINFYIANDLVVLPKFGCAQDEEALKTIAEIFNDRKVYAIDANEILVGGGGIHCITMQQPKMLST
ncbi:agmatine deiminase family protein [Aliikangiella coralliicola]|uniref:Agmatine deiminase family protein n=1 Tax=Aliikangiella coralliicola TaxID=2592383 RepID=A0A545UBJ1_9GAMM|nr:agmatine deiminase family protein [Aliikangiella coralliicola]TQV86832.1 agmatine deiminase family protein [Aliikangiella coralliicola]